MLNRKSKAGIILAGIAVLAVLGAAGYKGYLYYREVKNTGTYVSKEKYEYFTQYIAKLNYFFAYRQNLSVFCLCLSVFFRIDNHIAVCYHTCEGQAFKRENIL